MIDFKLEGIEKALETFNPAIVKKALSKAINDVAQSGLAEIKRHITSEYNIKPSRVNQYLRITARSSGNTYEAIITGKGKGIPRGYFSPKQENVIANKKTFKYTRKAQRMGTLKVGGDVTTLVKYAIGRKIVSGEYGNKPFIAKTKTGHIDVFERTGKKRLPIKQLFAVGVAGLLQSHKIVAAASHYIQTQFVKRFAYWLNNGRS